MPRMFIAGRGGKGIVGALGGGGGNAIPSRALCINGVPVTINGNYILL